MQRDNDIILTNVTAFRLDRTFDCGQCFRWNREPDGSYLGIAGSNPLRISQSGDTVTLYNTSLRQFHGFWFDYFDLYTDYIYINQTLCLEKPLRNAFEYGDGIRILNQELWECTVSFIISQSNNIPRIKNIIGKLCFAYGKKIEYSDNIFYSFPSPDDILNNPSKLSEIGAGYRDKYILSAAEFFKKEFSKEYFKGLSYESAKKELMRIHGVGSKVADCISLFGLGIRSSFPVDVWIKRIMEELYFGSEQPIAKIEEFAKEHFGSLGGYAQQYLFYYARENKIGIKK